MDLEDIKSLSKQELLLKLKQRGFEEVAQILYDNNVDGETLIELRELDIIRWNLKPSQKKVIWNSITEIQNKPSLLINKEKFKPRSSFSMTGKKVENKDPDKIFKGKLQNILGSAGSSVGNVSTLPNTRKAKASIPITKVKNVENKDPDKIFKGKLQNILGSAGSSTGSASTLPTLGKAKASLPTAKGVKSYSKPLPPPPAPSPPPRNNAVKPNVVSKKPKLPPPKGTAASEEDQMYLQMSAPTQEDDEANGEYLTPLEVSLPYEKSPNMPRNRIPNEGIPKNRKADDRNKFLPISFSTKDTSFDKELPSLEDDTEETYEKLEEVIPSMKHRNPMNTPRKKLSRPSSVEEDTGDYESFPTEKPLNSYQKSTSLKDLKGVVVIDESNTQQEQPLFSFLTSLNPFGRSRKPKNLYENHIITNEEEKPEPRTVTDRPLPDLPSSPKIVPNTLFSKPFPPPRPVSLDLDPQANYVKLTDDNRFTAASYISQVNNYADDEQITYNIAHDVEDEEEQIYENTPQPQDSNEEEQIYENTLRPNDSDEEEQIYENTPDIRTNIPPSCSKAKPFLGAKPKKRDESRDRQVTEERVNVNSSSDNHQAPKVKDLAFLLSEKLRMREQTQQMMVPLVMSDSDSEFDDDCEEQPIYGNISNEEDDPSPTPEDVRPEDRKIPIYKTALPEVPKHPAGPSKFSSSVDKKNDFFKGSAISNKNTQSTSVDKRPALPNKGKEILPTSSNISPDTTLQKNSGATNKHFPNSTQEKFSMSNKKDDSVKDPGLPSNTLNKVPLPPSRNYERHTMNPNSESGSQRNSKTVSSKKEEKHGNRNIFDLNEEPFYRNIDRKGAKQLLLKYGNGSFLFRPSRAYFLVLTVKHDNKIYNFGIERTANNMLQLNTEGDVQAPEFSSLLEFVTYFREEPVTFDNENEVIEIFLTNPIPPS